MKTLRLILGDQLNAEHSWFKVKDPNVLYTLMEARSETDYAPHHIQKVVGFFASMRNFADALTSAGNNVRYFKLDDPDNLGFEKNIQNLIHAFGIDRFEYQLPDEYRLDKILADLSENLDCEVISVDTEHFLTERSTLSDFFAGKKSYLMESFYRSMRKKHGLLMIGDQPEGGKWNYDGANRKKLPKSAPIPEALEFDLDVRDLVRMIRAEEVRTIGNIDPHSFKWPTSRREALELLNYFAENLLPLFGTYQDAMDTRGWSLYHSRLSFALNLKMISPLTVVQRCIQEFRQRDDIELNQIEGFVRQIIGWREYMRGIYWAHMPEFGTMNFLKAKRKLPSYFWDGNTKMNCIKHAVTQSLDEAYAHHIQRLMITGNFGLLAGIDPHELDRWYLGIYIDAIEWVEMPNTRGMSQFADGGIVGTKPYNSSANYVNKMSNYCSGCTYNYKEKVGENACPFNSLYWNFYERHENEFKKNPRIGMAYRNLDRMDPEQRNKIRDRAEWVLENLDQL